MVIASGAKQPWHPPQGTVLGVYYIETTGDLAQTAEFIAREESAGSWVGKGSPTESYARAVARVHAVQENAPGRGHAAIAFPTVNLPDRGSLFPAIWLHLTAGPLFERPFADVIRLTDVVLPDEVLAAFRGPRFGIEGTRALLRKGGDALLFGAIVKPGAGLVPDEVALRCGDAAFGGIDLIKDVPIYVHSGGRSLFSQGPKLGIDTRVFAKFVRLLGGDFLDLYAQGGYLRNDPPAEAAGVADVLRGRWGRLAPVLPSCSGGLTARTLGANYAAFGRNILPMVGSAIFNHPLGAAAGVVALRQAAESYVGDVPLDHYSRDHPELAAALRM